MIEPSVPPHESKRLAALHGLLVTTPEERFDRITRTATRLFDVPIALICLVDADRQWVKSRAGLTISETPQQISFCAHTIFGAKPLIIPDALSDPRFTNNPLVVGEQSLRFYAGWPLAAADGSLLGTLCIFDRRPRELSDADRQALGDLAAWAENELGLITTMRQQMALQSQREARSSTRRKQAERALLRAEAKYRALVEQIPAVVYIAELGVDGAWHYVSPQIAPLLGFSQAEWLADPQRWYKQIHPDDRARVLAMEASSRASGAIFHCEYRMLTADGRVVWVHDEATLLFDDAESEPFLQGFLLDITERRRTEETQRRQNEYLAALHDTTLALMNRLELADLLEAIVARAAQLLDTRHGYIYLTEPGDAVLEFKVGIGAFDKHIGYRLKPGEGLAGKVWQTGQPLAVTDYHAWPDRSPLFDDDTFHAVVGVPMISGAQVAGVIGMARVEADRAFGDAEIALLGQFAQLASIALDNARLYTAAQQELGERTQAERALRESERRYRELYAAAQRQAQDLALLGQVRTALAGALDLSVVFRTVVEAITSTFGYTQVSLYLCEGDTLVLQHQVGYDRVIARIPIAEGVSGRVVRTGRPVLLEDVRADPTFLGAIEGIVSEICVPLFDDDQVAGMLNVESVGGVTLSHTDLQLMVALGEHISIAIWRARLYTEARESASILRGFYDSSTMMMGVVEVLDDDILHFSDNAATARFFGRTPESMRNQLASQMGVPPDALRTWIEHYRASAHSGQPVRFEYAHEDGAGTRWLAATVNSIAHAIGERPLFSYVVDDVTERKRAEETLHFQKTLLECQSEAAPDGILVVSGPGKWLMVNRRFAEMWGLPEQIIAMRSSEAAIQESLNKISDPESFRAKINYLYAHPDESGRDEIALKDGRTFDRYSAPVKSADGIYYGRVWYYRDITERKQIERLKSEFIATVSHELRTPLTSIRGSLGLVINGVAGALPARAQAMIEIAHKNSERLMRLINDILDIEKIESGKIDFVLRPLALAPLIEQAVEANRAYAEQYEVTLRLQAVSSDIKANVDADRLMQVLTNLLSNAAKFSPRGEEVVISAERATASIRIAISDRGPGIPTEFRARMFQKFAQAESSDNRQKGGTGLGLSISKMIVEKLGGRIDFVTGPGAGTTFYVELPEWHAPAYTGVVYVEHTT